MGQEIELKMSIDETDVGRLFCHPFIARHSVGQPVLKHLFNRYFDTPEQILRENAMAFRIRFDGSAYVQTLKQKGKGRNGLSVRGEWEWIVNGPNIEPNRVPSDIWPPELRNCLDRLAPLFRTDFQRTMWTLQICSGSGFDLQNPARVEMSLDQGIVATEKGHETTGEETIIEVEFELLEGDTEVLFEISRRLGEGIHLIPCDISKAERGYRLLNSA